MQKTDSARPAARMPLAAAIAVLAFALIAALLSSCAPAPESIHHSSSSLSSGPGLKDPDLKLGETTPESLKLVWSDDVSAASAIRFTENLLAVQDALPASSRAKWVALFLGQLPGQRGRLAKSAYADLLAEQSEDVARAGLNELADKLKETPDLIRRMMKEIASPVGASEVPTIESTSAKVFAYLKALDRKVDEAGLASEIVSSLHKELARYIALESRARAHMKRLRAAATLTSALNVFGAAMDDLGLHLAKAETDRIARARVIATEVDGFADAHAALVMLVDVWIYLDPATRTKAFQAANEDLYDYFKDLSDDDLRCLANRKCFSIPKWIARNLIIEPKIKKFGLEKLRGLINVAGADSVRAEVAIGAAGEARVLPATLVSTILDELSSVTATVQKLRGDFKNEVRRRLASWASAGIEKRRPLISYMSSPTSAHLDVRADGKIAIAWSKKTDASAGPETAGALGALHASLWKDLASLGQDARGLVLSEIVSLAQDYRDSGSALSSSAASIASSSSSSSGTLSAKAYAESIRGLAGIAVSFRDWEHSSIDDLIGGFRAQELFPEFHSASLDRPLFPKDAFFALGFRSLAEKLMKMKSDETQVFLVGSDGEVIPSNQSDPNEKDAPAVMAGIADRQSGKLAHEVRAEDVARYLLSLCDVLEATRMVERSTSSYLLTPDSTGVTPRQQIIEGRETLRMLILGLANYLSHQFRAGGPLIHASLALETQKPSEGDSIRVVDQMLAIRALMRASDSLGTDVYRWEAVDLVSALNQELYRPELGFYALDGETGVSPLVLLESLRALDAVSPALRAESREQIEKLTSPWRQAIARWQLAE